MKNLLLYLAMCAVASAATFTVAGVSPTQAVLTRPSTAEVCKIEISESATYRPLVHDVDPTLFFGSNAVIGPFFVAGRRFSSPGIDGHVYSRALAAGTRHFARITCPSGVQKLDFITAPLAAGTTYNDGPQVDRQNPGKWVVPTRSDDRTQVIIDPLTGARLRAVSINAEGGLQSGFNGIFLGYGGFTRQCAPDMVGPVGGPSGFACTFLRYGQGGGVAYWIVPSTGEVQLLGSVPISGGGAFGPLVNAGTGLRSYGADNTGNTVYVDYVGNFRPSAELQVSDWHAYTSTSAAQLVHDFDPTFPLAGFECGRPWAEAGQYTLFVCGTGQDLAGWLAVLYGDPAGPRVVAAVDVFHKAATSDCTLHNVQPMGNVASINVQTLASPAPRCAAMGHMVYWRYLDDPHGDQLVVDRFFDGGGHWDHGPLGRVSETGSGWGVVVGAPPVDFLDQPYTRDISDSPFFAGARGLSWGSTTSKHPSYHQVTGDTRFLLDMLPFDGGQFYSAPEGAQRLSGQLYRYRLSTEQPSTAVLSRKQLPTLAVSGGRSIADISGPAAVLTDAIADSFKYCVALVAGECRADSAAGDVYVNAPDVSTLQCAGADGPVPDRFDLCIGNMGAFHQALTQVDITGAVPPRVVTYGLAGIRNSFFYSTAKALPDGSWALFSLGVVKAGFGNVTNVFMAQLPPLVADGVDRTTFRRVPIALTRPARAATAVSVAIEFGYAENGPTYEHWCTSRHDVCIASTTGPAIDADPFRWATESWAPVPCPTSCTIVVPVVPDHIAYWRATWFNQAGQRVATGPESVIAP